MSTDLDETAIKVLKYIISCSKNGSVTFSLEDAEKQLQMNTKDILDALRTLERLRAIKLMNPSTPDFILKNLVFEAAEYDLMYFAGEIDEQTYKKRLEELLLRPSLKELSIDKTCLNSNLVNLREALNNIEYILQAVSELVARPFVETKKDEKQKIISDFSDEFLDQLIYVNGFLTKLRFLGEMALESLDNLKKLRTEAKVAVSKNLREKYEESRKNMVRKSMNLFILGSILYPDVLYEEKEDRKCDSCGKTVQISWKYCKFCGSKINQVFLPKDSKEKKHAVCYNCKSILPIGSKFCPECGFSFSEEIARVESTLSELKVELELLNARKLIEGNALTEEIREKEVKYREAESRLEELRKAFQESETIFAETSQYFAVNVLNQKFNLTLSKKINIFKDLASRVGLRVDESFKESVEDILESEKEVIKLIQNIASDLPLSLQEYDMLVREDRESLSCSSCGFKNDSDASFCIECGNSLL